MVTARPLLRVVGLVAILVVLGYPTQTHAESSPPLPATLYPPHTRISVVDPLSNVQMDCDWGFDCLNGEPVSTAPIFHLHTQDDLHRLSGWAQFGDASSHGSRMLFAAFASTYDQAMTNGMPGNVMAFTDFRMVLMMEGYRDLLHYPHLLPRGALGNSSVQLARSRGGDVLAMSCWTGAIEVEGVVLYRHGSPKVRRLAMDDLSRQVRALTALRAEGGSAPATYLPSSSLDTWPWSGQATHEHITDMYMTNLSSQR